MSQALSFFVMGFVFCHHIDLSISHVSYTGYDLATSKVFSINLASWLTSKVTRRTLHLRILLVTVVVKLDDEEGKIDNWH